MTRTVQGGGRLCKRGYGNSNPPAASVVALAHATGAAATLAWTALFKQAGPRLAHTL